MINIPAEIVDKCRGLKKTEIEKLIKDVFLTSSDWMLVNKECRRYPHTTNLRSIALDKALQTATCLKEFINIADGTKGAPIQHKEVIEKILDILVRITTVPSNEDIELLQNSSMERLKAIGWLFAGKRELFKSNPKLFDRILAAS